MDISPKEKIPLCVDLDGTLTPTDFLWESVIALLKKNILYAFLLPVWILKGKARLKENIAYRVELDIDVFPINEKLVSFIKNEKEQGRNLVLATASDSKWAKGINQRLNLFSEVLFSDGNSNLSGARKAQKLVELFGERGFDYAGNAKADLEIWKRSRQAIVVNAGRRLEKQAAQVSEIGKVIPAERGITLNILKAMRIHQWVKNSLIFVPIGAAQLFNEWDLLFQVFLAFLAFGFCASNVYIINDLLDLTSDRHHSTKCKRPFAAGLLPIPLGVVLGCISLVLSFSFVFFLPIGYLYVLLTYYCITWAYSISLKKKAIVDVLTLAGLYTIRIVAGGAATGIEISFWLLAFSIFFFFSLALVKRYSELLSIGDANDKDKAKGRGYYVQDLDIVGSMGIASGYTAVMVLALYINSDKIKLMYKSPEVVWFICPLFLYWISRMWILTRRGQMASDPVVFAAQDSVSRIVLVCGLAILLIANIG